MKQVLQVCAYLIGVPLELMVIAALLRGEYRNIPSFFFMPWSILTTVLEIQSAIATVRRARTPSTVGDPVGANERITQVLVLLLVLSLVYSATKDMRPRRTLLTVIICGTVIVAVISSWLITIRIYPRIDR